MPLFLSETSTPEATDLAACRQLLSNGSKSFFAASFFLPKMIRDPAAALYAFCRVADDAIDEEELDQQAALERLRERLDRVYQGRPLPMAPDRAFAATVERFALPRALPEALLEGFEWDADGRRYDSIEGVLDYSARVAAAVGAMMTVIMGVRSPAVLARACDLGTAMQLTNICRDVGEDARNGRIYLPVDWLREEGLDIEAWLADPVYNEAVGAVTKRVLDLAEGIYQRAESGIAKLPVSCRPGIYAARLLYAEIGREVVRNGYDSVTQRAVVPSARKVTLLSRAVAATPFPGRGCAEPALAENQFLVDAAATRRERARTGAAMLRSASGAASAGASSGPQSVGEKVVWVLELFASLDERQRVGTLGHDNGLIQATGGGG
ncbi:phytoene/squalene synthase family protein [Halochromatium glycolicum]|uniref:Phytoene synthase n=1 Tax=Halochromatium glycolicum TaxID=85075 RepID=A0AAJ0U719_9GAMM|nr:phytoene/squalene synthase family protein [Halochromatium glycolicum]MBK1706494.1 phytoene synthase [Halochromatium glycolicum]